MRISDWSSDVCSSDLHGVTGIIVLHHRASLMPVAEAGLNTPLEGPKSITKPGIAVTMGCAARYSCHSSASVTLLRLISRAISGQYGPVRSEERRVGKEGVITCGSRGSRSP